MNCDLHERVANSLWPNVYFFTNFCKTIRSNLNILIYVLVVFFCSKYTFVRCVTFFAKWILYLSLKRENPKLFKILPQICGVPNQPPDSWSKPVSNIDSNLRDIRLFRSFQYTGHCGEYGYAQWATAADLIMHNGPLQQIWFCTMGHCGDFLMPYGSVRRMKPYCKNLQQFPCSGP
jgi:hypothetical protein